MEQQYTDLALLLQANHAAQTMQTHAMLGLPHPLQVAQSSPFMQELIRTKAAKARSWSQFLTSCYNDFDAELKFAQALVEGQRIMQDRTLMGEDNHG